MSLLHKKKLLEWLKVVASYIVLIILIFGCIQPQYFQIDYQKNHYGSAYPVYASFSDNDTLGAIKLDNLIVGEDGSSKVSYTVKAGDTIHSIAQQFGTTAQSIIDSNGVTDQSLKAGRVLYISYDNGVLIYVKKTMSLKDFVAMYNLDLEDTMSLNYIEKEDEILEQDQELFVNLTQKEAEKRNLIEKQLYESPFEKLKQDQEGGDNQKFEEIGDQDDMGPVHQEIISPEETAQQIADQFKVTREEAGVGEETPTDVLGNTSKQDFQKSCEASMCLFDGNCYYKPQEAYCIKDDPKRMRKCKQGFVQQGNTCVTIKEKPNPRTSENPQKEYKKEKSIVKLAKPVTVGYFNPRADGAPSDGWGAGQCTSFAHWYWWKHYGIKSLGFRGNAGRWPTSAARAGWLVNKVPSVGAFGISNESSVGHVFVVVGVDGDKVLIQEMNYAGRYIVTKRWKSISSIRAFIHPVKTK